MGVRGAEVLFSHMPNKWELLDMYKYTCSVQSSLLASSQPQSGLSFVRNSVKLVWLWDVEVCFHSQ